MGVKEKNGRAREVVAEFTQRSVTNVRHQSVLGKFISQDNKEKESVGGRGKKKEGKQQHQPR